MNEERPIIFTITEITRNFGGLYIIRAEDDRIGKFVLKNIGFERLFEVMSDISSEYNNKGYAVLFEVD